MKTSDLAPAGRSVSIDEVRTLLRAAAEQEVPRSCASSASTPIPTLPRATRHDVARLREAIASSWDVGPELAHEERRLATLEEF